MEIDPNTLCEGFSLALTGRLCSPDDPRSFGFAFGVRLLRSIRPEWSPGQPGAWSKAALHRQLQAVVEGELTLLPSAEELEIELNSALELFTDIVPENLRRDLPPALQEKLLDCTKEAAEHHQRLADSAAHDRQSKYAFDRAAAAVVLPLLN